MRQCSLRDECASRLLWNLSSDRCYSEAQDRMELCLFRQSMRCGHLYLYRTGPLGRGAWCMKCKEKRKENEQ